MTRDFYACDTTDAQHNSFRLTLTNYAEVGPLHKIKCDVELLNCNKWQKSRPQRYLKEANSDISKLRLSLHNYCMSGSTIILCAMFKVAESVYCLTFHSTIIYFSFFYLWLMQQNVWSQVSVFDNLEMVPGWQPGTISVRIEMMPGCHPDQIACCLDFPRRFYVPSWQTILQSESKVHRGTKSKCSFSHHLFPDHDLNQKCVYCQISRVCVNYTVAGIFNKTSKIS